MSNLNQMRVAIESGPKGKKVVAVAPDWPGLERGTKTEEGAIERLRGYIPRYKEVMKLAGGEIEAKFLTITGVEVVEHYVGPGSTDFWGISFGFSSIDRLTLSNEELERELTLMQACWAFFDGVVSRVSAELVRGPRGGGRDRDHIVRHTFATEIDWARKLGVHTTLEAIITGLGLSEYRAAYCNAIRLFNAQGKPSGKWPLRYLIRHTAFHTLDHAWEMEDKDLTFPSTG